MYSRASLTQVSIVAAALALAGVGARVVLTAPQAEPIATHQLTDPNDDDMLAAGRHVLVQQEVWGDVAVAGADVTIDGGVAGYVMSAGRHVTLNGRVGNDLWAAGETVDGDRPQRGDRCGERTPGGQHRPVGRTCDP